MTTYAIFLTTGPCLTIVGAHIVDADGELTFYGPIRVRCDTIGDRDEPCLVCSPVIGRFTKTGIIGWCQMPHKKPDIQAMPEGEAVQ